MVHPKFAPTVPFPVDRLQNPNTCVIPGPVRPMVPNGCRMRSAGFPQCSGLTDRPTDRSRESLMTIGRSAPIATRPNNKYASYPDCRLPSPPAVASLSHGSRDQDHKQTTYGQKRRRHAHRRLPVEVFDFVFIIADRRCIRESSSVTVSLSPGAVLPQQWSTQTLGQNLLPSGRRRGAAAMEKYGRTYDRCILISLLH